MFKVLLSGGIVMIPIILCGIFATYLIVEKFIFFKKSKKQDDDLKKNLDLALIKHDYVSAESLCVACQTPLGSVISKAILNRKLREEDMKEITQSELDSNVAIVESRLDWLSSLANVSTLLGLFGTVCGNIKAFGILGRGGELEAPSALASAIGQALVTTAAGLFVAIPTLILCAYLKSVAEKKILDMEGYVTNVILRLTGRVL